MKLTSLEIPELLVFLKGMFSNTQITEVEEVTGLEFTEAMQRTALVNAMLVYYGEVTTEEYIKHLLKTWDKSYDIKTAAGQSIRYIKVKRGYWDVVLSEHIKKEKEND